MKLSGVENVLPVGAHYTPIYIRETEREGFIEFARVIFCSLVYSEYNVIEYARVLFHSLVDNLIMS